MRPESCHLLINIVNTHAYNNPEYPAAIFNRLCEPVLLKFRQVPDKRRGYTGKTIVLFAVILCSIIQKTPYLFNYRSNFSILYSLIIYIIKELRKYISNFKQCIYNLI